MLTRNEAHVDKEEEKERTRLILMYLNWCPKFLRRLNNEKKDNWTIAELSQLEMNYSYLGTYRFI